MRIRDYAGAATPLVMLVLIFVLSCRDPNNDDLPTEPGGFTATPNLSITITPTSTVTPTATPWVRHAFVSSSTTQGQIGAGGLAGADAFCQSCADAGTQTSAMGATWVAWVSINGNTDARDRIPDAIYKLVDDATVVATGKADLVDGALSNAIAMDENGSAVGAASVYTGTGSDGLAAGDDCNGWTDNTGASNGHTGVCTNTDANWTSSANTSSASPCRIYCFEQ